MGAFFYAELGARRADPVRNAFEPYLRAGTRITLIVLAIPLTLSLTLVALEPVWSRVLFLVLSGILVAANVDTVRRMPAVWAATRSTALVGMEALTTAGAIVLVILPWLRGGLEPTRAT